MIMETMTLRIVVVVKIMLLLALAILGDNAGDSDIDNDSSNDAFSFTCHRVERTCWLCALSQKTGEIILFRRHLDRKSQVTCDW